VQKPRINYRDLRPGRLKAAVDHALAKDTQMKPPRIDANNPAHLWKMYLSEGSVHKVGKMVGLNGQTVLNRLNKAGYECPRPKWSDEEINVLRKWYATHEHKEGFGLSELSALLKRGKANVSRKARGLGLTVITRKKNAVTAAREPVQSWEEYVESTRTPEHREASSRKSKRQLAEHGHPKGMLNKHHAQETKDGLRTTSNRWHASQTEDQKRDRADRALKTKFEKYGNRSGNHSRGSWKAGWRTVGGRKIFFRSRWEANYGRYLEFLKGIGEIKEWEHEPETFWFEQIKRGVRSYLPDFRVTLPCGRTEYHEVKGWMDARSKTTIGRFRKYYPEQTLMVIGADRMKALRNTVAGVIPEWERP